MKSAPRVVLLLLALFLAAFGTAQAQLRVGLDTGRFTYLLYEAVNLDLRIENQAGFDLVLQDSPEKAWLTFFITRTDHSLVMPDRKIEGKDLSLRKGESVDLHVNLTPLYRMRELGTYKIQAVISINGQDYLSAPIQIEITSGSVAWKDTRNVEGSLRTYSLVRFAPTLKQTDLYLRVEDVSQNVVYTNNLLGEIVDIGVPQTSFDPAGGIHVLQLTGNAIYRYTHADRDGNVIKQAIYDSVNSDQPGLVRRPDGTILVAGGREENSKTRRDRLSEGQNGIVRTQSDAPIGPFSPNGEHPQPAVLGGSPQSPPSGSTK